jgi:hypothetical protein
LVLVFGSLALMGQSCGNSGDGGAGGTAGSAGKPPEMPPGVLQVRFEQVEGSP